MDQRELKAAIDTVVRGVEAETRIDAQSPADKVFGALLSVGIAIVGELLLDVKRIADASGQIKPWLPPDQVTTSFSPELVARFLAGKEADRRFDYSDDEPGLSAKQRWVDGNWYAFQDEAADLIAAAVGERK